MVFYVTFPPLYWATLPGHAINWRLLCTKYNHFSRLISPKGSYYCWQGKKTGHQKQGTQNFNQLSTIPDHK